MFLIFEVREPDRDDRHAKCGVTWCQDLFPQRAGSVDPVRVPDRVAGWYDLRQEPPWPLRPPIEAGPQRVLRYRYPIHSWKDVPMLRNWITELLLVNHEDRVWYLSMGLPGELEVAAVMTV